MFRDTAVIFIVLLLLLLLISVFGGSIRYNPGIAFNAHGGKEGWSFYDATGEYERFMDGEQEKVDSAMEDEEMDGMGMPPEGFEEEVDADAALGQIIDENEMNDDNGSKQTPTGGVEAFCCGMKGASF